MTWSTSYVLNRKFKRLSSQSGVFDFYTQVVLTHVTLRTHLHPFSEQSRRFIINQVIQTSHPYLLLNLNKQEGQR